MKSQSDFYVGRFLENTFSFIPVHQLQKKWTENGHQVHELIWLKFGTEALLSPIWTNRFTVLWFYIDFNFDSWLLTLTYVLLYLGMQTFSSRRTLLQIFTIRRWKYFHFHFSLRPCTQLHSANMKRHSECSGIRNATVQYLRFLREKGYIYMYIYMYIYIYIHTHTHTHIYTDSCV